MAKEINKAFVETSFDDGESMTRRSKAHDEGGDRKEWGAADRKYQFLDTENSPFNKRTSFGTSPHVGK